MRNRSRPLEDNPIDTASTLKNLFLFIFSIFLAICCAEVICRLVLPAPGYAISDDLPGQWNADPLLNYRYTPNFTGRFIRQAFDVSIEINALGFRGPEPTKMRGQELRVLAAGNSLTFGWGVEGDEAWPARLQKRLATLLPEHSAVKVINVGVSGYSTRQIAQLLEEQVPRIEPDVVVVGLYAGGIDRIDNPYVLLNGTMVRSRALQCVRGFKDGLLISKMLEPWACNIDLWLDKHFYFGAHLYISSR